MGGNGDSTGRVNAINGILGGNLDALYVAASAVKNEVGRERRLDVGHDAGFDHRSCDVRTADVLASGDHLDAFPGDRVAALVELLHHEEGAPQPPAPNHLKDRGEFRVVRRHAIRQEVDLPVVLIEGRQLARGHEVHA